MRRNGYRTMGGVVFLRRCPASYVSRFTHRMLEWYLWLESWGKTPFDVGFSGGRAEDLDPRYFPAMRILKREFSRIEREELERARNRND